MSSVWTSASGGEEPIKSQSTNPWTDSLEGGQCASKAFSFHQAAAKDILRADRIEEYQGDIDAIAGQLIQLNIDLFIVDQIVAFPFSVFAGRDKVLFYRRVVDNFLDASLLVITRMATDQRAGLLTIPIFRNRMREWVKDEYRSDFDQLLKTLRFDATTREILARAQTIRDHAIAHTVRDSVLGIADDSRVTLAELHHLCNTLKHQLDALTFDTQYSLWPVPYNSGISGPGGQQPPTDIEEALDSVAKNSAVLHEPEANPAVWQYRRQELSEFELSTINRFRVKFGLPPA